MSAYWETLRSPYGGARQRGVQRRGRRVRVELAVAAQLLLGVVPKRFCLGSTTDDPRPHMVTSVEVFLGPLRAKFDLSTWKATS